jgi:hypothetical protein
MPTKQPTKRKPGRPPTPNRAEIETKVLGYIRIGLSFLKACDACGIADSTVESWRSDPVFSGKVKNAVAEREALWISELRKGGPGWQSKAWLLERTNREEWGQRNGVEVTGRDGGPIRLQVAENASPAEVAAAVQLALTEGTKG